MQRGILSDTSNLRNTLQAYFSKIKTTQVVLLYTKSSGVKSILKLYLSKSTVTDGKTTRSKVESIDQKQHLSKSKKAVI